MDDNQRRDDGMAQRRKVLGNEWVDKSVKNRNAFNTDFQDLITRYAWGDIWTRPHFDHRTRRVLVIGTMVALGQWDEFRLHVRAALAEGSFTPDDIKEILLQQAIYCGVPAANHAVKEANAIIAEMGLLKSWSARSRLHRQRRDERPDPVGIRPRDRIVDDHAEVRTAIDGERRIFHRELSQDRMAEALDALAVDVDVVVAPQGLEFGAAAGKARRRAGRLRTPRRRAPRPPGTRRPRSAPRSPNHIASPGRADRQKSGEGCCAGREEACRNRSAPPPPRDSMQRRPKLRS